MTELKYALYRGIHCGVQWSIKPLVYSGVQWSIKPLVITHLLFKGEWTAVPVYLHSVPSSRRSVSRDWGGRGEIGYGFGCSTGVC